MMWNNLRTSLLWMVFCCSAVHAQLLVDLSVDVTESEGVYTYTYSLANTDFSFQAVNAFLLTTGKAAEITEIAGPNGWVADYEKDGLPSFQAAFITGDGSACGVAEQHAVWPGQIGTFTIESTWAPDVHDYELGRLDSDCEWEGNSIDGLILSPSIAPNPPEFEPCDFDEDGDCDLFDINNLAATISLGDDVEKYDLTDDTLVDLADLDAFLDQTNHINGDADFNGKVEFADFLTVSGNFGMDNMRWSDGDFDANGAVAFSDFLIISGNYGKGEVAAASVPEPHATGLLAGLVLGPFLIRQRRR